MLLFVYKTFSLNNSILASWLYFSIIRDDVVNCSWDRVNCITWLTSSLKDIPLSFEFSSYILLCFWISSIVTIFVVYYMFFFNVLKSFMSDRRILFSFFSFSTCFRKFSISFFFQICVIKYKMWQLFFIRAKDQMSIKFIIKSDVLLVDRTETLVRHYLIKKRERVPRQIKLL